MSVTALVNATEIPNHGDEIVMVDFFAEWCGPCKKAAPKLVKYAEDHPHIHLYKVDIEKNPNMKVVSDVTAVPTFMFFKNGKVFHVIEGVNFEEIDAIVKA